MMQSEGVVKKMNDNNKWIIASVSYPEDIVKSKEEMEKIVLSSLPDGWEVMSKASSKGFIQVKLGHLSPYPKHEQVQCLKVFVCGFPSSKLSKYDFIYDLTVSWVEDKDMLDLDKTKENISKELEEAKRKLEQIKAGRKSYSRELKEIELLLKNPKKELSKFKEVRYLGEKARATIDENGEKRIFSILVNRFSIYGSMVSVANQLDPGSKPIHSVRCEKTYQEHEQIRIKHGCNCWACKCHSVREGCSTLKKEGYIHREEVENLLRLIISRLKREKAEKLLQPEIMRNSKKIKSPEEGMEIKKDDIINTKNAEIMIKDGMGNEISIKSNTEVKFNESETETFLELKTGEIGAKIIKLLKDGLMVRTPQAVSSVRGTDFGVRVEKGLDLTTLTVTEGKVEFSDLKGNKVIVKAGQFCRCTKYGLEKPITFIENKDKFIKNRGGD